MAKLFHSGHFSDGGVEYEVEIHDSTHASSSTAFVLGGNGFNISVDGDARDMHRPVMGTRCTFAMQLQSANESAINSFVTDLQTAPEKQFQVLITTSSGASTFWYGNVLTDISRQMDTSPSMFEVVATCGMAALDKVDYNNAGTAYTGTDTLLDHIVNCLDKIGTLDTFFTTENVITTVVNWYEDSHNTTASDDPLALSRVAHRAFFDVDKNANIKYQSCLKVLQYICNRMNARIYLADGKFRIETTDERENTSVTERYYQKDGTYDSNASVSHDVTLDQVAEARLTEGNFSYLPAIRKVEVTYHAKNWINYLAGASWTDSSSVAFTAYGLSIDHNSNLTTLGLQLSFNGTTTNNGYDIGQPSTQPVPLFMVFRIRIKVGTQYLKRDLLEISNFQPSYSNFYWDTSNGWLYHAVIFQLPPDTETYNYGPLLLDIVTPSLPATGAFEAKVEFDSLRAPNTGAIVGTSLYSITWTAGDGLAQIYSNGLPLTDTSDIRHRATADNGDDNSEVLEMENIIGDGTTVNSQGRIEVYNGSAWSDSTLWRVGTSGTWYAIGDLQARQLIELRQYPVRTYTGTLKGTGLAQTRWVFDSSNWVLLQGSWVSNLDEWQGTWAAISKAPTGITSDTPVSIDPVIPDTKIPVGGPHGNTDIPGTSNPPPGSGGNGGVISSTTVNGYITTGTVTTIATANPLTGGAFTTGKVITVINPVTGYPQNFTVTADTVAGDTSISVSGYASDDIIPGSFIVISPQNAAVQNYGSSGGGSGNPTSATQTSNWWDIFQQWWDVDNTNDINWPIEAPNIIMDTDEDAGDGATAGIRFDGDGLQSFSNSSATAGVKIGLAGKLELNDLAASTDDDVLTSVNGEVKSRKAAFDLANGTVNGLPTVAVASDGATITLTFDDAGASGTLNLFFSTGDYDFTTPDTLTLTAGTDVAPQINYAYILESTKALTLSTSAFPSAEHVPVATVLCQSAASLQTDGAYKVHAWTDHLADSNSRGHILHLNSWIRSQHASWQDGVACTPTLGSSTFDIATTSGNVLQLHPHTFPTFDTSTGSDLYVVNDSSTAYDKVGDLVGVLTDANGGSMSNKYYNLVLWGVVSEASADCKLMVNLPTDVYNTQSDAELDVDSYSVYDIPGNFRGTGFLISRLTVRNVGSTYTLNQNEDLRGILPGGSPGSGQMNQTEFSDDAFKVFDGTDPTKELSFEVSGVTTGTERTITVPDSDGTLALATGISGGQTINGGTASGDDLDLESTSNATKGNVIIHELLAEDGIDLKTDENAGNGSTSGVTLDTTDGLQAFNNVSSTPTVQLKTNGNLLLKNTTNPTPAAGLVFMKSGIISHADSAGTSITPNFGHVKRFQVIPYGTDWATGTQGVFWRVGSDYAGYQVYRITYGLGTTSGATGSNTVDVKLYDHSLLGNTTIDSETLNTWPGTITVSATSAILAADDALWFDVTAVRTTPAKGLMVEIYLRVPV